MTNKERVFALTRKLEGGWYDGQAEYDSNPTKWGVTQNTYSEYFDTAKSVKEMTEQECYEVYEDYWTTSDAELFGDLSAVLVFDHAFNAGFGNMRKVVQRALGVVDDGFWGEKTRAAIYAARRDDPKLATRLCFERMDYYRKVAWNPKKRPALLSWITRLVDYYRLFLQVSL